MEITIEQTQARINELAQTLIYHNSLYELERPIITDSEYDALYSELVALENLHPALVSHDSPTQTIAYETVKGLMKSRHDSPMLSQEKIASPEQVEQFFGKHQDTVLIQQKLDGLTIVLTYEEGKLARAVTRGDGEVGEDVTHTVRTIRNVPKEINTKNKLVVRMEVIIPFAEFERINTDGKYSNPRNLASGTIRQLDSSVAASRALQGIVFELVSLDNNDFDMDTQQLTFLKYLGFSVVQTQPLQDSYVALDYIKTFESTTRATLPHMIDGLILKFDDLGVREELGMTNKYPRWATAYKFASLDATTTLNDIVIQVGKSGQLTPVAEFSTVTIENVNISRATLHNFRNIRDKDIRIGDTILVQRANDVIPQVVKSLPELRTGSEKPFEVPTTCPACGSLVAFHGENLYCSGMNCTPQLEGKLQHFVSRDAMDIDGLGDKSVAALFQAGLITGIPSIYELHEKRHAIVALEGFGETSYEKMTAGIEASKSQPFERVLYGMAIPDVGRTASKELAKHFKSVILMASEFHANRSDFYDKLTAIPSFGPTIAARLYNFLNSRDNLNTLKELFIHGVKMESTYVAPAATSPISGKVFVITGALSKGRDEFKKQIEDLGGKVSGSVSKKTDYLLLGPDGRGTMKHQKAIYNGVTILSEEEYLDLL